MSHPHDYPLSLPQDFSTLEVRPLRKDETLKEVGRQPARLITTLTRYITSPDVSALSGSTNLSGRSDVSPPAASPSSSLKDLPLSEKAQGEQEPVQKRSSIFSRPWLCVLIFLTIAVVIALAVSIPLALHGHKSRRPASAPSSGNNLQSVNSTGTGNSSSYISVGSKLASLAWNDSSGTAQQRLFLQNNQNIIVEMDWNSASKSWVQRQIVGSAKANTPLAAVTTDPQEASPIITVYALSPSNQLVDWISSSTANASHPSQFEPGLVTAQNITASTQSSLAGLSYIPPNCPMCATTVLLAYERSDNSLVIGNYTRPANGGIVAGGGGDQGQSGWQWTPLSSAPTAGTDLALTFSFTPPSSNYTSSSSELSVQLLYQLQTNDLVRQSYVPTGKGALVWQAQESAPLANIPPRAPLAALSLSLPLSTDTDGGKGNATAIVLAGGADNITAISLFSKNNDPTQSTQVIHPKTLSSITNATALATNNQGKLFALCADGQNGGPSVKELSAAPTASDDTDGGDSGVTWTEVGPVDVQAPSS